MRVLIPVFSFLFIACAGPETAAPPPGGDGECSESQRALSDACLPTDLMHAGDPLVATAPDGDALRVEDAAGDALFAVTAGGAPRWTGSAVGDLDGNASSADVCDSALTAQSAETAESAAFAATAALCADSDALNGLPATAFLLLDGTAANAEFCGSAGFANFASDSASVGGLPLSGLVQLEGAQSIAGAKTFTGPLRAADVVADSVVVGSLTPSTVSGGSFTNGSFAGTFQGNGTLSGSFDGAHSGDGKGLTNVVTELRYDRAPSDGCEFDNGTIRCDDVVCATVPEVPDCDSLPAACVPYCTDPTRGTALLDVGHIVVPEQGVLRGRLENPMVCANDGGDAQVSVLFGVCQTEPCFGIVPLVQTLTAVRGGTSFSFGRTQGAVSFDNGVGATAGFVPGQRRVIVSLGVVSPSTTCFLVKSIIPGFNPKVTLSLTPFDEFETW
ncbi:MAG: hypothetical protein Q8O67_06165 [Deltaproteobacteria bacterium]|nr:hypothetical protein [Deltaproteobacteria bacterium]